MRVSFSVNGHREQIDVEPRRTLADALREDLGLTGTHLGCEQGVCGACTVLLDGEPVRSCLMLAVQADGSSLTTVEGLASESGDLHPLQQAFADCHGLQCGFCTPGFLISALHLLTENPVYKPFRYPWAYEAWLTQQRVHWLPEEVPLADDVKDWHRNLTDGERKWPVSMS